MFIEKHKQLSPYILELNISSSNNKLVDNIKNFSNFLKDKEGLEIGGPSIYLYPSGIYTAPSKLDNVVFSENTLWNNTVNNTDYTFNGKTTPGKVIISDIVNLEKIKNKSYDFIVASHILEHVVNPLKGISEITRILKDDGICILVLPWKEGTFDHKRPISSFSKLLDNYNKNRDETYIDDYLPEIKEFYDISRDPGVVSMEHFLERCKNNYNNRALHVHVFDFDLIIQCLEYFNYKIIDTQLVKPYHQIVIGQKNNI